MRLNLTSNSGQALWLAIANFISFSFGIVSAAILSRFLSVEEYGSYKQVLYIYSTLLTVFTLGLPRAYSFFLARLPIEEGRSAVNRINGIFLILGLAFSLTLFFGSSIIASILKNPELSILLKWFSPTPLFLLPVMGLESIMATYRKASYATVYVVLSRLFTLACVVIPVLLWGGPKVAVIGFSIASMLCFIVGILLERKPFKGTKSTNSSLSLREVISYSIPLLFASIWGILAQSTPQFFISRWWGAKEFAEFSNGFIELPFASMIMGAVSTVLLPAFSREVIKSDGTTEILRLWNESFIKSAMIIFPLSIYALLFARPIMIFLYGDSYSKSSIYFQIIGIVNISRVMQYGPILLALKKTKEYARLQMYCFIIILISTFIYTQQSNSSPYGVAIIYVTSILFLIFLQFRVLRKSLSVKSAALIPLNKLISIIIISLISSIIPLYIGFVLSDFPIFIYLITTFSLFICILISSSRLFNIDYFSLVKRIVRNKVR